jgi:hypothetical protein
MLPYEEFADVMGPTRCTLVPLSSSDDGPFHQDMPFPGEVIRVYCAEIFGKLA